MTPQAYDDAELLVVCAIVLFLCFAFIYGE
jgi:hypothetical protein